MADTPNMRERILGAAEKRVRAVGFNAVSFRDLAGDVGVKSSSIHHHFPQKENLGEQLVARYTENFQTRLDRISEEDPDPLNALEAFIALYGEALVVGKSVCLCAILGAEANGLPDRVNAGVQAFFAANKDWLSNVLGQLPSQKLPITAAEIIVGLEGAMIYSSVMKDREAFDVTARRLLANFK